MIGGAIQSYNENDDKEIHRRYCKGYKWYPIILPKKERIIAIGDLHGDFELTLKALKLAKVIDNNNKWIGGGTYVVQVGDQLDSCRPINKRCDDPTNENLSSYSGDTPEDIKIMEFLNDLNEQAIKDKGAVISLLGNHEIMNVEGKMHHVSYQDIVKFKNYTKDSTNNKNLSFDTPMEARIHAFKPGNEYAKLLACSRLPAVIIGSFIFVHAGFINSFMDRLNITKKDDLYKISVALKKWLLGLIDKNNVIDIINAPPHSMFWHRVIGSIPPNMNNNDKRCQEHIDKVLEIFDASSMIIGHTPQFAHNNGINSTCDGKVWRIDFGGSFGFDKFDNDGHTHDLRDVQVLEIIGDGQINILK